MANKYATLTDLFTAIADAIRFKTEGTGKIVADDFPSAIDAIATGVDLSSVGYSKIAVDTFTFTETTPIYTTPIILNHSLDDTPTWFLILGEVSTTGLAIKNTYGCMCMFGIKGYEHKVGFVGLGGSTGNSCDVEYLFEDAVFGPTQIELTNTFESYCQFIGGMEYTLLTMV